MKLRNWLLVSLGCAVGGCVTTTSGDVAPPASKEEAARLNTDLGISYLRQGDMEQAMIKLEKAIQENPDSSVAHRALGHVYENLGDASGAEKEYRIAVRQAPDDADAVNDLAVFLCRHDDPAEGLKWFGKAFTIPLYQSRHMLYTNAGTCAKDVNLVQAENYLRQAVALKPDYSEALYQLGDVAYLQENYLQARAFIERYTVVARVSTPDALWLGYRVELAMNNPARAETFAEQLLKQYPASVEARMLLEERRNAG